LRVIRRSIQRAPDLAQQHSEMLIADVIISEDW
jgi:hypothetical protein